MCVIESYNRVLELGTVGDICTFIDEFCGVDGSKNACTKLSGGCDYLGFLDDKVKELEGDFYD